MRHVAAPWVRRAGPAVVTGLCGSILVSTGAAATAAARTVAAFPGPGDGYASPATRITFSGMPLERLRGVRVTGSRSGGHGGELRALRVGAGAVFVPRRPFAEGERVTVRLPVRVRRAGGRRYAFGVARWVRSGWKDPSAPELRTHNRASPCELRDEPLHTLDLPTPDPFCMQRGASFRLRRRALLVSPRAPNDARFVRHALMVISGDGKLLWYRPSHGVVHDLKVVRHRGRPALAYYRRTGGRDFHEIRDERYRRVARVYPGNGYAANAHEFTATGRDTVYLGMYVPVRLRSTGAPVTDFVVQEVDVLTGDVLFEWHALDHVPISASYAWRSPTWAYDYFHGNAIEAPRPGRRTVVVSARKTSAVYGIDRLTGRIRWILGGKQDQFGITADRGRQFCAQHDVRWVGERDLSVFDNGSWALRGGCPVHRARILRFRLDEAQRRARLVRTIGSGPSSEDGRGYRPVAVGSARWQPDGDVLVNWGNSGRITEISPGGRIRFKLQLRHWTYRAVRARWEGRPRGRPSVVAEREGGGIAVWASWNGATAIARWRLLAGDDRGRLLPSGFPVAFAGLETRMRRAAPAAHVAVEALDATGRVLGRSAVVAVRPGS